MAYFRCTTSGSGTGATITVSYESEVYGQTLTCTDGTHTYTKTAASTGSTVFAVPNGGTWTISVVMYGHTYSQQVIVVSEYTCTLELWSATVNISTTATELYGQTITVKKGGSTIGSTAFDSSGSATYIAPETGTYTFECTYSGQTYSASVNVTEETTYSVVISMGLELSQWLTAGGLDPSDYADLSEVLADQEAVRRLMTIHDSVDYLATASAGDQMMETIIADDLCAKWINLRDYALDTLYANSDIADEMDDAGKYFLGEWVCEGQVPVMTSDTAPYGQVICHMDNSSSTYQAKHAFDGNSSTAYYPGNESPSGFYLGYIFQNPVNVKKVMHIGNSWSTGVYYEYAVYGGNSIDDLTKLSNEVMHVEGGTNQTNSIDLSDNDESYLIYVIKIENSNRTVTNSGDAVAVTSELQFYAYQPKGNVPIMTSNTAPYGEAIRSSAYTTSYEAWLAFNGVEKNTGDYLWCSSGTGTIHSNIWLGYKFVNPQKIKKVKLKFEQAYISSITYKFQASNDGSTWIDISDELTDTTDYTGDVDNDNYYIYYRLFIIEQNLSTSTIGGRVFSLQFYGREMKVSVPTMTSNTAPWGEAFGSTPLYGTAHKAFIGLSGDRFEIRDASTNVHVGYCFPSPIVLKMVGITNYGIQSDSYKNLTVTVKASHDETNWETILDDIDISSTTTSSAFLYFNTNNDAAYRYYAVFRKTAVDGTYTQFGRVQFFGFDYSERDWDTEHPMKYLYDHGVELENLGIDGFTFNGTQYKSPRKEDSQLYFIYETSGMVGIGHLNAIDLTDYDLSRICIGNRILTSSSQSYNCAGYLNVAPSKEQNTNRSMIMLSPTVISSNGPSNISLDISSINGDNYNTIYTSTDNARELTVTEWWLE